ncbi:MAG: AMP-binding protein [Clostridiales bacterium]|nr:AMP-binding protein [Clostridiales bacterium]
MSVPTTFHDFFQRSREKYEETGLPPFKYMEDREVVSVSTEEFFSDLAALAEEFVRSGYANRHIGLMGENSYLWMLSYCALLEAGAVPILLSKDLNPQEIAEYCKKTDTFTVVCDETVFQKVSTVAGLCATPMVKASTPGTGATLPTRDPEALGCILFTSGTTGDAKAVMLSVKALLIDFWTLVKPHRTFETGLTVMPYHHLAGFSVAGDFFPRGSTNFIGKSPKDLMRYLRAGEPEYMFAVPEMVEIMAQRLRTAKPGEKPLGKLRMLFCGGAKFPEDTVETFSEHDIELWHVYSASESGGHGIIHPVDVNNPSCLGPIDDVLEAKVVDGELLLRGDTVMMGYYKDPEATAAVLTDGWYHTGDLCRVDENGNYYLTGRKKNLIILSNGENVSPEGLEAMLRACPFVEEVLVKEQNNFLCAEVLPTENTAAARKAVEAFLEERNDTLPSYKQIHFLKFRDTPFEKTAIGKIKRA